MLILRDGLECLAIFTRNPSIIISVVQERTETMRLLFGISLNAKKVVTRIPSIMSLCFFQGVNMIRICTFSICVLFFPINSLFKTHRVRNECNIYETMHAYKNLKLLSSLSLSLSVDIIFKHIESVYIVCHNSLSCQGNGNFFTYCL